MSAYRDGLRAPPTRALVLLGHGSHLSPSSGTPVYEHAQRIRETHLFDEVIEGFWKEEPSLRDVLDLVESDEVYVVPLFLAEGYFTTRVLPREMGLEGNVFRRGGQTVRYCMPVGGHPAMRRLILDRALNAIGPSIPRGEDAALVIVGHGTPRSSTSGDSVYRLAEGIRDTGEFATVTCGFLDEEPRIEEVLEAIDTPRIVLVPFFVAEGWHTADTIPRELGLTGGISERSDRIIHYTPPVGTLPGIADVVLEIVSDAVALDPNTGVPSTDGERASRPSVAARRAFLDWIDNGGAEGREFLQLVIRGLPSGRYELRHRDDRHLPDSLLQPRENSRAALGISRLDEKSRYRPLRTAASLVSGWVLGGLTSEGLWEAVSLFYPAAVLHWHLGRSGSLEIVPFNACAQRQSGAYEGLRDVSRTTLETAIEDCCGSCLRTRLWDFESARSPARIARAEPKAAVVPCREPCTVLRTAVREAAGFAAPVEPMTRPKHRAV